jgi:acyl-coenzyme A synthetase/AMP-(fatty) acid ligase
VPGTTMYKTGDLVHRDGQGRYVYDGRLDDVVKRNGVRISLGEVARSVLAAPGVTGSFCALVARDGAPGIAAFVVAGASVTVDEMRAAAAAQLPESMLPDEFVVVPTLPMTSQGKVDRRRLLADAGFTGWH